MIRLGALLLLLPTAAWGQVQEIVVTGRGLDTAPGDAAYDVTEIGRDQLDHAPSSRLEQVLLAVPGFTQFRRSDSRSANPTSQGATLRSLGGNASSRALLTLDGVPQIDPFGGWISWPDYDPRRLGRIRVIRGGGSGVDGPGALAGTIALDSAGPGELAHPEASLAYGSRDSVDLFLGGGVEVGPGFVAVSGDYQRGDGFTPIVPRQQGAADRPAPYRQASFGARAVVPVGPVLELQANLSAFDDQRTRGTAFSAIETRGADASLRLVGRGGLPFSALVYLQLRGFSNQFAAVSADRSTASETLDQYQVPAKGAGARVELRPSLGPVQLRLGADTRDTVGRTEELFQYVAGAPTRGRVAGGRTDTAGAFAEAAYVAGPLTLTAGGRLDHWWITDGRLDERVLGTGAALTDVHSPDRGGWAPTGRAGLAWRAAPMLTLRAAAYLGWRLPTLNELYRPFRVGPDATAADAALSPERLRGIEAGAELRPFRQLRFGLTLFDNRLTDAIANVTMGQGPGNFPGVGFVAAGGVYRVRENVDAISSRGVELDANLTLGRFSVTAGYAFADARVHAGDSAAALEGLRPAQTPRHDVSLGVAWRAPTGLSLSADTHYVASQYEDDLNRQLIPDALTFDARADLPLTRHFAIEARAENLTDKEVIAGISGAGILERATPRTLWLGLSWRG